MTNTKIIRTADLVPSDVPDTNSNWNEISLFALSFDPQLELNQRKIYSPEHMNYDAHSGLQELRFALFLRQRWWNNRSEAIDEEGLRELRNILRLLRKKLETKD